MQGPPIPRGKAPSYRTQDGALMSLDTIVRGVQEILDEQGLETSVLVVRSTILRARLRASEEKSPEMSALAQRVSDDLRAMHVLFIPDMVEAVMVAYVKLLVELEVAEILDVG